MNANLNLPTPAPSTAAKALRTMPSLFTTALLMLGLLLFCAFASACNITSPEDPTAGGGTTDPANVKLVRYDGGFFTMMIPKGWRVEAGANVGGDCAAMYVIVTDPSNPMRKIFYINKSAYFARSEQQRQLDLQYYNASGILINLPVAASTPETFLTKLHLMVDASHRYPGFMVPRDMPTWDTLSVLSSIHQPAVWSSLIGPTDLMRAVFVDNGKTGQGLFIASVVPIGPDMGMAGAGNACAYAFGGIMAPKGEFRQMQEALAQSASSLSFSDVYMYTCIGLKQADISQRQQDISRTMSETSNLMNDSWRNRNRSEDISAEKWSDAMRGTERLYDPSSGDVYEFNNGFYDTYQTNSGSYMMSNLEPLPDDAYDLWMKDARDGYTYLK